MNWRILTLWKSLWKSMNHYIFSFVSPKSYYESGECNVSRINTKPFESLYLLVWMSNFLLWIDECNQIKNVTKPLESLGILNRVSETLIWVVNIWQNESLWKSLAESIKHYIFSFQYPKSIYEMGSWLTKWDAVKINTRINKRLHLLVCVSKKL